MKEWKLIRKADDYVSMVYYQESQPEFSAAFGEDKDFKWEQRDLIPGEFQNMKRSQFLEILPQYFAEFIEAYHEKETDSQPAKMNALLAQISLEKSRF
jgi:hypothetical protein